LFHPKNPAKAAPNSFFQNPKEPTENIRPGNCVSARTSHQASEISRLLTG